MVGLKIILYLRLLIYNKPYKERLILINKINYNIYNFCF